MVVSVSKEVWQDSKSFLSPSRPPAIYGGLVWFLVWLGSHEDVGSFSKGEQEKNYRIKINLKLNIREH